MTPVPEPFVVRPGKHGCPHHDTQLVTYRSPTCLSSVWSCPTCHRIVRQDCPDCGGDWTEPKVLVPHGLEGLPIPGTDRRGWGMPDAADIPASKKSAWFRRLA